MTSTPPDDDDRTMIAPQGKTVTLVTPPPAPGANTGPASASSAGDSGSALPVGTYLSEFELQSVLGEGGFGIVYLAWDHSLERRVALKEYMPSSLAARNGQTQVQVKSERHRETFEAGRKSFINEAKLLAQFDHPSLVKVYRFWEANGTAYMVMPFYEGVTLKDRLRQLGAPPDEAWLMGMLGPLTEALVVIHAENCFHRDIAPDNVILLGSSGRPLLLDFGAARRVIGDMTQALTVILKPGYAPIEQYAEAPHMKQGGWTDVYALAATVHYAITGRTPPPSVSRLMGDSYQALVEVAAGRYSPGFLAALDKALRVRPEERTQSIAELRADLGLDGGTAPPADATLLIQPPARAAEPARPAAPPPAAPARSPSGSKKTPLIALAAVLLVGGGGLAAYLLSGDKPAAPQVATPAAAPPAAPAAPPPVAAPAPFDVLNEFDRLLAMQDAGFAVEAKPAKPQLRIGRDSLAFSVSSARDGYVQVLLLGPDGSLLQLFPNSQASDNRIKAGQVLRLPHASWPLETAEPAGTEHFMVLVSEQQRDYSALSTEREYGFLKLPTGAAATALAARWPHPTPLLLGGPGNCQGERCDAFGAARFTLEVVR